MGVLDKFLDAIKLNDDYDDDEFLDEDLDGADDDFLDDEEEDRPKKKFFEKFAKKKSSDDEFDEFVDNIKSLGIQDCLDCQQAAYDRYLKR